MLCGNCIGLGKRDVLKKFRMVDCNSADTPTATGVNLVKDPNEEEVDVTLYRQMVGSLRYLCCTRPNLLYVVGLISRYMENPELSHFRISIELCPFAVFISFFF